MLNANPEKPKKHNAKAEIEYIRGLLCAILEDGLHLCPYQIADYKRDVATINLRLQYEGLMFATSVLPSFFNDFALLLEGGMPSFLGFKKSKRTNRPAFLQSLVGMVLHSTDEAEKTNAFSIIYALCSAFKKLKGDYKQRTVIKTIDGFVRTDEELGKIHFDPSDRILIAAKYVINTIFHDVSDIDYKPMPGPGATNTPTKQHLRYEPHVLYAQLEDHFPTDEYHYAHPWDVVTRSKEYLALDKRELPTSRYKLVHKYHGKPRGICIEENEVQWRQQLLKNLMYDVIQSHPLSRGHVNFVKQEVNQGLALSASSDKFYATLDLSEASDRVSRVLVHKLFKDTWLLDRLDAVSTRIISFADTKGNIPEGVNIKSMLTHKYAPMGSAVCFPVMSIVIYALITAYIMDCTGGDARSASRHVYVYGDDIIVPSSYAQQIMNLLAKYGFKVNVNKSFVNSHFRESCGVHAFHGVDVTPVYNNYTITSSTKKDDTTCLLSSIAKEYAYHCKDMHITARYMRVHIRSVYGQLPNKQPDSPVLGYLRDGFPWRHNIWTPRRRWNVDYQRWEYKVRVLSALNEADAHTEDSRAYLRWLVKPPLCSGLERDREQCTSMVFRGSPEKLYVSWKWVPEHALGSAN